MKLKYLFIACLCCAGAKAQIPVQVEKFHLQDVTLLESPFSHAQEVDKSYLLALDPDRLLAPYLREAGLSPKAESYTNWENTGLDGHIGGHYVTALSLMYAATGDAVIKERLDYMISEWKRCQDNLGTGYIGGVPGSKELWESVAAGTNEVGGFSLGNRWVPLYNIHKVYAGLRDAWEIAGIPEAKDMLIKMTDWMADLLSGYSDEQIENMLRSEYGGLNEVFADVATITGDKKYLEMAKRFSHRLILNPLLEKRDDLTGKHANTQIPKVIGFKRVADLEGNDAWDEASAYFWDNVVNQRSVSIGGNSAYEHFHPVNDYSRMLYSEQGPETCNTYNMLKLTAQLYQTRKEASYMDFYERALYNHILSTQHPETGGFVYFTPMRPGHYRVYSQPQTSFWCCVGSGLENHAKYGEMIYGYNRDELYVNLFIPSRLDWKARNSEIIQQTTFPDQASTKLIINPKKTTLFTLCLRYPGWVKEGEASVKVNGKSVNFQADPDGYIRINRKWKKGDQVEYEIPMHTTVEQIADGKNFVSILHGPIVLAAKTTGEGQTGLFADDSRGGHIAHGSKVPLNELPFLVENIQSIPDKVKQVSGEPLTFTLDNIVYPDKYADIQLIPFFRLHESRYILYWQQTSPEELESLKVLLEKEEAERMMLDKQTVDYIICGEQQPESDHFYKAERSGTGLYEDIHYRDARGWFEYELRNPAREAGKLRISYVNNEKGRGCEITMNDTTVGSLSLSEGESGIVVREFELPRELTEKEKLVIRFVAPPEQVTPRVTDIRLMK